MPTRRPQGPLRKTGRHHELKLKMVFDPTSGTFMAVPSADTVKSHSSSFIFSWRNMPITLSPYEADFIFVLRVSAALAAMLTRLRQTQSFSARKSVQFRSQTARNMRTRSESCRASTTETRTEILGKDVLHNHERSAAVQHAGPKSGSASSLSTTMSRSE